jgi:hypothetical protein
MLRRLAKTGACIACEHLLRYRLGKRRGDYEHDEDHKGSDKEKSLSIINDGTANSERIGTLTLVKCIVISEVSGKDVGPC